MNKIKMQVHNYAIINVYEYKCTYIVTYIHYVIHTCNTYIHTYIHICTYTLSIS